MSLGNCGTIELLRAAGPRDSGEIFGTVPQNVGRLATMLHHIRTCLTYSLLNWSPIYLFLTSWHFQLYDTCIIIIILVVFGGGFSSLCMYLLYLYISSIPRANIKYQPGSQYDAGASVANAASRASRIWNAVCNKIAIIIGYLAPR